MNAKTTIIVLIVLGVLFVASVLLGVGNGDGGESGLSKDREWINWMGTLLIDDDRTRLDLRDIVPQGDDAAEPIASSIGIAPGGTRQFKIIPSEQSMSLRRMLLALESGPAVQVAWDPKADNDGNQQPRVQFSLKPGAERATQKLMIESPGGTLTLRCAPGNRPAEVRLVE